MVPGKAGMCFEGGGSGLWWEGKYCSLRAQPCAEQNAVRNVCGRRAYLR